MADRPEDRAESMERPDDQAAADRFGRYVDALLGDGRPSPEDVGDLDEAEMARLAAELSGASSTADPAAAGPDPAFVEQLRLRMRQADEGIAAVREPLPVRTDARASATHVASGEGGLLRMRVSRRTLLQTGLGAAAGLAAGLAGGAILRDALVDRAPEWPPEEELVAGEGMWVEVATLDELPEGGVLRFTTAAFDGFVVNDAGEIRALSASCTHLGCTLTYRPEFRDLRCPCHPASFNLRGWLANSTKRVQREGPYPGDEEGYPLDLPPLPQPKVKVTNGRILVLTAAI
jgi:cytochrome b6-f complex iron-sulfur subunit